MQIYPTMELLDGHCVTLEKGRLDEPQIWHVDPIEKAREFAASGAEWMHLTDFNAVKGAIGGAAVSQQSFAPLRPQFCQPCAQKIQIVRAKDLERFAGRGGGTGRLSGTAQVRPEARRPGNASI